MHPWTERSETSLPHRHFYQLTQSSSFSPILPGTMRHKVPEFLWGVDLQNHTWLFLLLYGFHLPTKKNFRLHDKTNKNASSMARSLEDVAGSGTLRSSWEQAHQLVKRVAWPAPLAASTFPTADGSPCMGWKPRCNWLSTMPEILCLIV